MRENVKAVAQKTITMFLVACLAMAYTPIAPAAYAEGLEGGSATTAGTVECSNGWVLTYEASNGEASITGVDSSSTGSGALEIPSTAGDANVTSVGEAAFKENTALTSVSFPDTLQRLEIDAFRETGLTSVSLPSSLAYVQLRCFYKCANLATVTFAEGSHPEFLGTYAFYGCSALTQVDIPPLYGDAYKDVRYTDRDSTTVTDGKRQTNIWRIGYGCFTSCTKLSKVIFRAGGEEGSKFYLQDGGMQFGGNASGFCIINFCKGVTYRSSNTGTYYLSVNFYKSKAAAEADKTRVNPWKQLVYKTGTGIIDILKGTAEEKPYEGSDAVPSLSDSDATAGQVWGVSDQAVTAPDSELSDSIDVYPVDPGNLECDFVTSPEIQAYNSYDNLSDRSNDNSAYVRLTSKGADLSGIKLCASDGSTVDAGLYTFKYEKQTTNYTNVNATQKWEEIAAADIKEAGTYRVHAVGAGEYAKAETETVNFYVRAYRSNVKNYATSNRANNLGSAAIDGKSGTKTPLFMVVAPASNWQYSLMGVGLAAVGGSQVLLTDGASTASDTYSTLKASNVSQVNYIGSKAQIGSAVTDRVKELTGASGTFFSSANVDALAVNLYKTIAEYGPDLGYDWGDTAVVVSGTKGLNTAAISQYVYQAKAPVFFTASNGTLSSGTLSALKSGGFTKIIVAGNSSYVSAAAAQSIQATTGITPTRLGDVNCAYEASVSYQEAVLTDFVDEKGVSVNAKGTVVVAAADDAAFGVAAGQFAALKGGVLYSVASSAAAKAVEERVYANTGAGTKVVYQIGSFAKVDSGATKRFESLWADSPLSTAVAAGDTFEVNGLVYKVGSGSTATLQSVMDKTLASANVSTVSHSGKTYTVTGVASSAFANCTSLASVSFSSKALSSVPANLFSGCSNLKNVSFAGSIKSVGAGAFSGCSKLSALPAALSKASSIGANAFKGCTALKTISVSASSIGTSAFAGCTSVTKATLGSASLTSIAAGAFSGCSKLKSVTLKSKKIKTVGASAFSGCKSLASLSLASTKLTSIGKQAFNGCKKLKTLTIKSKKLKSVDSKACKGMPAKATVKVPKAKLGKYKKLFKKAGLSKKAKFKKA